MGSVSLRPRSFEKQRFGFALRNVKPKVVSLLGVKNDIPKIASL